MGLIAYLHDIIDLPSDTLVDIFYDNNKNKYIIAFYISNKEIWADWVIRYMEKSLDIGKEYINNGTSHLLQYALPKEKYDMMVTILKINGY